MRPGQTIVTDLAEERLVFTVAEPTTTDRVVVLIVVITPRNKFVLAPTCPARFPAVRTPVRIHKFVVHRSPF